MIVIDPLTKFLAVIVPLSVVACTLSFHGWYITGIVFLYCAMQGYGTMAYIGIMVAKDANNINLAHILKCLLRISAGVFMVCLFVSCNSGYNYLSIMDPSTSLRGVGVEELGAAYKRNPNAYDVVTTDGFVQTLWSGYVGGDEEDFSAAPIYKDLASASGTPLAWAIGSEDGYWKQIQGTYCPGGGLCGFAGQSLSTGSLVDSGHTRAAKTAAKKGGFDFPEGLPSLLMVNPFESLKRSERWYGLFYHFLMAGILCGVLAELNLDDKTDESQPLIGSGL